MIKKSLYNQEEDNESEEMENDSELKELGDEDLDSEELGETKNPKGADDDGALDEEN